MDIARIVILVLLAALLFLTGGGKLAGQESSHAIRDSLRLSPGRWKAIGAGEFVLVAGLIAGIWFVPIGVLATAGVVVLMIGAVLSRRAVGGPEQRSGIIADLVFLAVAAAGVALGLMA